MAEQVFMKAPKGVSSAVILGHDYEIPKDGVIKIRQEAHIEELRRHGFVEHFDTQSAADKIDGMDDKDELVAFIEERGGEADNSMGLKKLKRLAHETLQED